MSYMIIVHEKNADSIFYNAEVMPYEQLPGLAKVTGRRGYKIYKTSSDFTEKQTITRAWYNPLRFIFGPTYEVVVEIDPPEGWFYKGFNYLGRPSDWKTEYYAWEFETKVTTIIVPIEWIQMTPMVNSQRSSKNEIGTE